MTGRNFLEKKIVRKKDKKLVYKTKNLRLLCDDFISTKLIDNNSIDLIITSPPYNVDIRYNSNNDAISYEAYLDFSKEWFRKAFKLTKYTGRFCLNIPLDKNKGGQQSVYGDLLYRAKKVGWKYHTTIVWNEQNMSRRTAWGSFMSASAPYIIAPVEMILILYKGEWKKAKQGTSDITKEEFIDWTNGVWTFNGESKKRIGHPAPFPLELPKRCIKLFSYVNDIVLDPFVGSGTTLVACKLLDRKGVGVDIDPKYCQLAKDRITITHKKLTLNL